MCKERREGGGGGGRPVGFNGVKLGARFSLPHGSIFPSLTLSKAGYLALSTVIINNLIVFF